ncbi:hypothetical protein BH11ACT6_BH11ACT6_41490 [soil metagenome]
MEISLRSYLTAGVSLTAASAIAFTPLVMPANEKALTIPSVSISDIQLAVTPADIEAFIANIQGALDDLTATVAEIIAIPGQTLVDVILAAEQLNDDLYSSLIGLTDNATIIGLLTILNLTSSSGLASLANTVGNANATIVTSFAETTELLTSALTGSLQNVLIALVNVVNDPTSFASYAGLVNAPVASGQLLAFNGISAIGNLGNAAFGLATIGLNGLTSQVNILGGGLNALLSGLGTASGSEIVQAALGLIQGIVIAPALIGYNTVAGVASVTLGVATGGFNILGGGALGVVTSVGNALQSAITAIGADPLDPASYVSALAALTIGGFGTFNTLAATAGGLAQLPINLAGGLNSVFTGSAIALTTAFAGVAAGLFEAVGLPTDGIAEAAANIIGVITDISTGVSNGLATASGLITDGVTTVLGASNEVLTGILDALGNPVVPAPPIPVPPVVMALETNSAPEGASMARIAPEGSGTVVAASNEVEEEAPADEAPPAEEAPADDDDSAGSGSSGDDSESTPVKAKKTERGERAGSKADRSNSKAGKDSKDSDSSSSGGSSSSSDSGSDSGSGSDGGSEA